MAAVWTSTVSHPSSSDSVWKPAGAQPANAQPCFSFLTWEPWQRAAEAWCRGVFFKVCLYFCLAVCSRSKPVAVLFIGLSWACLLSASATSGLRSLVSPGEFPPETNKGSKLSQPCSGNMLKPLTNMFSPKCSSTIWGKKIWTKKKKLQRGKPLPISISHLSFGRYQNISALRCRAL